MPSAYEEAHAPVKYVKSGSLEAWTALHLAYFLVLVAAFI